jgi:hypothetical protein
VQRTNGIPIQIRVGLNIGEVVVRAIASDLHMDYTAVGQTTHLAARMEQIAMPGSILITPEVCTLAEGYIQVNSLGPVPIKGMPAPVKVSGVTGAGPVRTRLQAAVMRGLTCFVGCDTEFHSLDQALQKAGAGRGQVITVIGEVGVGKSRLMVEFLHSPHPERCRVLESAAVSYGKATPYFPVIDQLRRYYHLEDAHDARAIHAKVSGQVLTLDEALQETIPPCWPYWTPCHRHTERERDGSSRRDRSTGMRAPRRLGQYRCPGGRHRCRIGVRDDRRVAIFHAGSTTIRAVLAPA